jgi:hypothetical protein
MSAPLRLEQVLGLIRDRASAANPRDPGAASEALALAILALEAFGTEARDLLSLRRLLTRWQAPTGAVLADPAMPQAYWPTGWAVLAWRNEPALAEARARAVAFLRVASGTRLPRDTEGSLGHDTTLRGWAWIGGTHSWVEPTALALLALDAEKTESETRVAEAVRLLLDRQLPAGGWNYGNTRVFRNTLRPLPEDTGYAVAALRPHASARQVEGGLAYLTATAPRVRAPAALTWSLLGLAAWDQRPAAAGDWIEESLARQSQFGPYPLRYLAQLVIAYYATRGLASLFSSGG